jgi:hypothetical protein
VVATIKQVDPRDVLIQRVMSDRDIAKQEERLRTEGQIEPIRVIRNVETVVDEYLLDDDHPDYWAYSNELVMAARRLCWDTILVSVREKKS